MHELNINIYGRNFSLSNDSLSKPIFNVVFESWNLLIQIPFSQFLFFLLCFNNDLGFIPWHIENPNFDFWMDITYEEMVWKMECITFTLWCVIDFSMHDDILQCQCIQLGKFVEAHVYYIIIHMIHQPTKPSFALINQRWSPSFVHNPHHCFNMM